MGDIARRGRAAWPFVAIALGPIVVVLLLRLPLINQLVYADPWFYSGYAWAPQHEFAVFGWTYYAVRFPAIISIGVFERVFGVEAGYVLLRYLLAVLGSLFIYLCARRFCSRRAAVVAALLLYLQPFYTRMLLWDYAGFMAVAAGVIAVATWYWTETKRLPWTLLPGVAGAAAVFAQPQAFLVVIVLFAVELLAAIRGGRVGLIEFVRRAAVCLFAAVLVFLLGYLAYLAILGHITPWDLLKPTIEFVGNLNGYSAPYQEAVSSWLFREPRVWMPVVVSVALIAKLGRDLLGRSAQARLAQLTVGLTAFFWIYRFALASSIIETWYAYDFVAIAIVPAMAVLMSDGASDRAVQHRLVIWTVAGGVIFAAVSLLVRRIPAGMMSLYHTFGSNRGLVVALLALGVGTAIAAGMARSRVLTGLSVSVLLAVVAFMSWAPTVAAPAVAGSSSGGTGLFALAAGREWKAYRAGDEFIDLLRDYDSPQHRVLLWYPYRFGYVDVMWLDLPQFGDSLNGYVTYEPLRHLSAAAVAKLHEPQDAYVMMLAPSARELRRGSGALRNAGFVRGIVRRGSFAAGRLQYELVELEK